MDNSVGYDKTTTGAQSLEDGQDFGPYRIVRLLGRGGAGEVYKAEHKALCRHYALKLLPLEFSMQHDAPARFQREAQALAQLEHPNITKVDGFGYTDGRYWLQMELAQKFELNGTPCHSLADLANANGGWLAPEALKSFLRQIFSGLALAHQRGVVHCNLKPTNILLSVNSMESFRGWEDIKCKISDFGLARLVGEEWLRSRVEAAVRISQGAEMQAMWDGAMDSKGSRFESLLSTFEHMSPEQKKGSKAEATSDVYAIGAMAYRLLTGRPAGSVPPSKWVKGLDLAWDDFVEKALAKQADDRYQDIGEMLLALDNRLQPPASCMEGVKSTRRNRLLSENPPPPPPPSYSSIPEETRRCPQCGETILAIAKRCKHCRSDLGAERVAPDGSASRLIKSCYWIGIESGIPTVRDPLTSNVLLIASIVDDSSERFDYFMNNAEILNKIIPALGDGVEKVMKSMHKSNIDIYESNDEKNDVSFFVKVEKERLVGKDNSSFGYFEYINGEEVVLNANRDIALIFKSSSSLFPWKNKLTQFVDKSGNVIGIIDYDGCNVPSWFINNFMSKGSCFLNVLGNVSGDVRILMLAKTICWYVDQAGLLKKA